MAIDFFYQIPNSQLLILFIIILSFFNLIGLCLFLGLTCYGYNVNDNISTYITIVSIVVGVLIASIISNEIRALSDAELKLTE